jgi:hypothetical protein
VKHYDVGYVLLGRICVYIFCKNIDRTFYKRSSECFVWFDDLGGYLWARFLTVQFLPWLLSWFGSGVLRFFSVFEIRCGRFTFHLFFRQLKTMDLNLLVNNDVTIVSDPMGNLGDWLEEY